MSVVLRYSILLVFICSSACHAKVRYTSAAQGYSVSIEDEYGRPLDVYTHQGKTYVLGRHSHRYRVRVRNHTSRRIEAVVTVDGRDAISGEVGDYKVQRGYMVGARQSILVDGFRQSASHVASFRFTNPGNSYSARMGTPQHIGVVGVAVFPERRRPRPMLGSIVPRPKRPHLGSQSPRRGSPALENQSMDAGGRSGGLAGARHGSTPRRTQNLGTQYGESRHSPTRSVRFVRQNSKHPATLLAVYYDDVEGLAGRGIRVHSSPALEPSPFPRHVRYAPPPP